MQHIKRILIFALAASLLITPLDYLQVLCKVETADVLWLVPLKFGLVGALLGGLSYLLDPKAHPDKIVAVLIFSSQFVLAYLATLLLLPVGITLGIMIYFFAVQSLMAVRSFKFKVTEMLPFIALLAIAGPLVEWIGVKTGSFSYLQTPGTVPYWLPLLWANGAFFTRALVGYEETI